MSDTTNDEAIARLRAEIEPQVRAEMKAQIDAMRAEMQASGASFSEIVLAVQAKIAELTPWAHDRIAELVNAKLAPSSPVAQ